MAPNKNANLNADASIGMPLRALPKERTHELRSAAYGENFQEHLLKQYELYVEMAERISTRRMLINVILLIINIMINGQLISLFINKAETSKFCIFLICSGASVLCVLWFRIIQSYERLIAVKFQILHELELMLPAKPFYLEWNLLGEGKDYKKYIALCHIEQFLPWIFICIYLLMAVMLYVQAK